MNYQEFIEKKTTTHPPTGFPQAFKLHKKMFPFQKDLTNFILKKGRAGCFASPGLGKTWMEAEWAKHVHAATEQDVLLVAPLGVNIQTVDIAKKHLNIKIHRAREQADVKAGITITNYEMLHKFDPSKFIAVGLDEGSVLKDFTSATRNECISMFQNIPYRTVWTATPAPNDYMELGNYAEFLGVCTRMEMLTKYFVHDGGETAQWRLKGHAQDAFWRWLTTWAVAVRKPPDLGYSDEGFDLPQLHIHKHILEVAPAQLGMLFAMPAATLQEQRKVKRDTIADRCLKAVALAHESGDEGFIIWCELNDESTMLTQQLNCMEIRGSMSIEEKEDALAMFADRDDLKLVTKPSITAHGLNWQHVRNMAFVNISHSWELFFQAIRRCYRFGQKREVYVHLILTDGEVRILDNLMRKQKEADEMMERMVEFMKESMQSEMKGTTRQADSYEANTPMQLPAFLRGE